MCQKRISNLGRLGFAPTGHRHYLTTVSLAGSEGTQSRTCSPGFGQHYKLDAIFHAAKRKYPDRRLCLRQGSKMLADSIAGPG